MRCLLRCQHIPTCVTPTLIFVTWVTCMGSSLLVGFNLSVLNLPGKSVKCFLNVTVLKLEQNCVERSRTFGLPIRENRTWAEPKKIVYSAERNHTIVMLEKQWGDDNFLYSMADALFVLAGAFGALCTAFIADTIGRRNGLLLNSILAISGGIITGPTIAWKMPLLFYIGRCVLGFNAGLTVGLASMYLTEIAPRHLRGVIGGCHQLAVTIGIVIGNVVMLDSLFDHHDIWSIGMALTAVPAFIGLCFLPCCPESPTFLLLKRNKEERAKKAFKRLNTYDDLLEETSGEMKGDKQNTCTFYCFRIFTKKRLRLSITIACLIQVMQQLSGIDVVIAHSGSIFRDAGVSAFMSQYYTIGIGIWHMVLTLLALCIIEFVGRRKLFLISSLVLAGSLLFLFIVVDTTESSDNKDDTVVKDDFGVSKSAVAKTPVIGCYIFIGAFAFGLGPIPSFIVAEVTRQESRATVYAVSMMLRWITRLFITIIYPRLYKVIGRMVFFLCFIFVIILWIFFLFFMPKTRNRKIADITNDLATFRPQFRLRKARVKTDEKTDENVDKRNDENSNEKNENNTLMKQTMKRKDEKNEMTIEPMQTKL